MGELKIEKLRVNIPLGKITTKLQASIYRKKDGEFVKSKDFIKINTTLNLFGVEDGIWANIGEGRYVTELNSRHYDISYGLITALTDSVLTCSRNGFIIRKLKSGTKLKVRDMYRLNETEILYKVGDKEYIHSSMPITFVMGEMLIQEDGLCHLENDYVLRATKGEIMPYMNVRQNEVQLLTGDWINPHSINAKLLLD